MSKFTTPICIENVIFDMRTGTFYSSVDFQISESANECYKIKTRPASEFPTDTSGLRIFRVEKPTYFTKYLHYCFAHAYLDYTVPLLSILDEVDRLALQARDFGLFVAKDPLYGYSTDNSAEYEAIDKVNDDYFRKTVDFEKGEYKGEYAHFHKVLSKEPVMFEQSLCNQYDVVEFSRLIIHGNIEKQRNIHNHASNYPDRWTGEVVSTDSQICAWVETAKEYFRDYFQIPRENPANPVKKMIVVARRMNRSLLPQSIARLTYEYENREDIDFLGVVYLEEMSLREQIELFRSVDIIVSTHGSGLSHLIWSKPGTKVYEIWLVKDRRWPIFSRLCDVMGLSYRAFYRDDIPFIENSMFEIFDQFFSVGDECFKDLADFIA